MMKLYIATPINALPGDSFRTKWLTAKHRCNLLVNLIEADERFYREGPLTACSTFAIHPDEVVLAGGLTEEQAMADCVKLVLEADAIYLDHGWESSKGCRLEYHAAKIYGKKIYEHDKL